MTPASRPLGARIRATRALQVCCARGVLRLPAVPFRRQAHLEPLPIGHLMALELSPEGIEKLLKGVTIPPRPALLLALDAELNSDDPDLKVIEALITKDIGVSAAMLRTLNSPLFGLSR